MSPEKLVYMANQIGRFFVSQGADQAVAGTLDHIRKFWDPRMRAQIVAHFEAGGEGLKLARQIYAEAFAHREELCAPYATVIDINTSKLPSPGEVEQWTSEQYTSALRHVPGAPAYNSSLRQLLHVGFKIAAKLGPRYIDLVEANGDVIAKNVTENLFDRHIAPVFIGRS